MKMILESPHTNPSDELASKRASGQAVGSMEVYQGKKVIADGQQSVELHPITGNPHADPWVVAYVPSARALFFSDVYVPGVGAPAGPDAVHFLQAVQKLGLKVETNIGGHGAVAPFAELVKAAAAATRSTN